MANSAALADAAATMIGNHVTDRATIELGLAKAREISGLSGVVIVADDTLGIWGRAELVELEGLHANV
jgi:ApbE superfamily uncharacterized protein (UPF0280 family)